MNNQEDINDMINQLPPYPKDFMPWTKQDEERYKFEPTENSIKNMKEKLFKIWVLWADLRSSKKINQMLSTEPKEKESDEYIIKGVLVNTIDKLAKILTQGDLIKELFVEE